MAESIVFGTDGWRGWIAREFTFDNVRRLADALARALPARSTVLVGYDHRFLSREFAEAVSRELEHQQHRPILSEAPVTSPMVSWSLKGQRAAAGVMITASHNPPAYNGFKVKLPPGCSASPEFTQRLEQLLSLETPPARSGPSLKLLDLSAPYLKSIAARRDPKGWKKPISLVVDAMHGSAGPYIKALFGGAKIDLKVIRTQRDPLFGGTSPEPVEKNLAPLSEAVRAHKADLGLALDGDGDRLGVVDEQGRYRPPHDVFPLILLHLLRRRKLKGRVVQAVSLGYVSQRIARKAQLRFSEVPVGFKYVAEEIIKGGVLLGGEESGGYGIGLWSPERDGLLCGLLLAEAVSAEGGKLSEMAKAMETEFGASIFERQDYSLKAPVTDKAKWAEALAAKLPSKWPAGKVKETRTSDGLKIILEDESWLLLRPSGTEPLLRTYAESPTREQTKQLLTRAQEFAALRL